MSERLDREIAGALDAEPEWLPLLPELLHDLDEIGGSVETLLELFDLTDLGAGARALDLGCGKGVFSIALAERGLIVTGVDAFEPFIRDAESRARNAQLEDRCRFRCADLRDVFAEETLYDLVMMIGVGQVLGDVSETVGTLRSVVRARGWLIIDDSFLADAAIVPPGYETYVDHDATLRQLESHGDELIAERLCPPDESRAVNERNTALIRARAQRLRTQRPEASDAIDAYIRRQEEETDYLAGPALSATWLLRRGP